MDHGAGTQPPTVKPVYRNPVYDQYMADPFVLLADGAYYAYGTTVPSGVDGRMFRVLRSADLVHWTPMGGALEPLDLAADHEYWAPEVAHADGTYYLYYSVGIGDVGHQLRVATAQRPEGPFRDTGVVLTKHELFAIDPCPFRDVDGQWYLFYAHDVLHGDRPGTSIAVDRLREMTRLDGEPRTILRATGDWQIFRRERPMYGSVYDWHTLEGPSVVRRDGRYYCFYSGGSWEAAGYGVSYAVADSPLGPWSEPQPGPVILRSTAEAVGPGHNSVVTGPDGADYLTYHAWDAARTARRMFVDRLEWGPEGPRRSGPRTDFQPVPGTPRPAP